MDELWESLEEWRFHEHSLEENVDENATPLGSPKVHQQWMKSLDLILFFIFVHPPPSALIKFNFLKQCKQYMEVVEHMSLPCCFATCYMYVLQANMSTSEALIKPTKVMDYRKTKLMILTNNHLQLWNDLYLTHVTSLLLHNSLHPPATIQIQDQRSCESAKSPSSQQK